MTITNYNPVESEYNAQDIERMLELLVEMETDLYEKGLLTLDDMWW